MAPGMSPAPFHVFSRSVSQDLLNAKNTLSSWDNCMAKAYCKWPVIVAIVAAGLVVLSILFCCARCLCCGLECCCGICSCCNACCPSPRGRKRDKGKYEQAPQQPYPPNPYWPQNNMNYGVPQFASFDAPSNKGAGAIHADSLPPMPSWETAQSRKVEDTSYHGAELDGAGEHGAEAIAMGSIGDGNRSEKQGTWRDDEALPMLPSSPTTTMPPQYSYGNEQTPMGPAMAAVAGNEARGYPSPYANDRTPSTRYQNNPYQRNQGYVSGYDNQYTANNGSRPTSPPVKTNFSDNAYLSNTAPDQHSPTSIYTAAPSYHTRPPTLRNPAQGAAGRYYNAPQPAPQRQQSVQTVANGFANYAPQQQQQPPRHPPVRTMSESTRYESSVADSDFAYTQTYPPPEPLSASAASPSRTRDELFYPPAPPGVGRKPVGGSWER